MKHLINIELGIAAPAFPAKSWEITGVFLGHCCVKFSGDRLNLVKLRLSAKLLNRGQDLFLFNIASASSNWLPCTLLLSGAISATSLCLTSGSRTSWGSACLSPRLLRREVYTSRLLEITWVFRWVIRLPFCANRLLQPGCEHGKGFSPVCFLMWTFSVLDRLKAASQIVQWCGLPS